MWRLLVTLALCGGCERLLKLDEVHAAADGGGGGSGTVDAVPAPPACLPSAMFGTNAQDYTLFGGASSSALTVSFDSSIYLVEVRTTINQVYRRSADGSVDVLIVPPGSDELAEPTIDPEANVLYVRDKTAADAILAYQRDGTGVYQQATALDLPTGKRAGNQTLDLGGFRRMVVQYDIGGGVFVFQEYEGTPQGGWMLYGAQYAAVDLGGVASKTIVDPAISPNGLNLTFVLAGDVYLAHRGSLAERFAQSILLRTGTFSSPVLSSSCRDLYVVDKTQGKAHRYQIP